MRNFVAALIFVVGALALAGSTLITATRGADQNQLVTTFTTANVSAALQAIGAKEITSGKTDDGTVYVTAKSPEGLYFNFILQHCDAKEGCAGLQLDIIWEKDAFPISLTMVNGFNAKYLFAKAFQSETGELGLSRYLVCSGGITLQNVEANLAGFFEMPEILRDFVTTSGVTLLRQSPSHYADSRQRQAYIAQVQRVLGPIPYLDVQKQVHAMTKNPL